MDTIIQLVVLMGGTLAMAIPFGLYIARMISFEMRPLEKTLAKVESGFYKLVGIDATKQMTWKQGLFCSVSDRHVGCGFYYISLDVTILFTISRKLQGFVIRFGI